MPLGTRHTVTANKEVILAAGVIGTPQILQVSGIGPTDVLSSAGIPVVVENPGVGEGYQDHPAVCLHFEVNSTETWDSVLQSKEAFEAQFSQWKEKRTGLFVNSPANTQSYIRLAEDDPLLAEYKDPAVGPNSPHMEFIFIVSYLRYADGSCVVTLVRMGSHHFTTAIRHHQGTI